MPTTRVFAMTAVLLLATAGAASASITEYTDRALWQAAAGPIIGSENFEGFFADTPYGSSSSIPLNDGMTLRSLLDNEFGLNLVDVPPPVTAEINVNDTNAAGASNHTTPLIDFASPIGGFGADFHEMQDDGVRTSIELYGTGGLITTLTPSIADGTRFYGFAGDAGEQITQIRFVQASSGTNDTFGFDNIEITSPAAVPEPASLLFLGTGLAGLAAWRQRRK